MQKKKFFLSDWLRMRAHVAFVRVPMQNIFPPWSVAIICARETADTLGCCIAAAIAACAGRAATIDVLVNGNRTLADEMQAALATKTLADQACTLRRWFIPMGDKRRPPETLAPTSCELSLRGSRRTRDKRSHCFSNAPPVFMPHTD
jgi:hypothetical protein